MSPLCREPRGCHSSGAPGRSKSARSPRTGRPAGGAGAARPSARAKGLRPGARGCCRGAGGTLTRPHTAGKTFPERPRHGPGSPPASGVGRTRAAAGGGGGGGGPCPPLCSRGRGSRARRWDEVPLPRRQNQVGSRGFPSAVPWHGASSAGEERGGRAAPGTSEAPGPPRPCFPAGSRQKGG